MSIIVGQAPLLKSLFSRSFWGLPTANNTTSPSKHHAHSNDNNFTLQTIGSKKPKFGQRRRDQYDVSVLERTVINDDNESQEGILEPRDSKVAKDSIAEETLESAPGTSYHL